MARRPLPMAAFHVMISKDPATLATKTAIEYDRIWDTPEEIKELRAMVNGRCQDLLTVIGPEDIDNCNFNDPEYLCRIEFLHRSVQDFLSESKSVQERLDQYADLAEFDADLTLFACYVFLVKRTHKMIRVWRFDLLSGSRHYTDDWTSIAFQKAARNWSNEAFFHMRSISPGPTCASLLMALDNGMEAVYAQIYGNCHWSNHTVEDPSSYGHPPMLHDLDALERGSRDLLGHLIEFGLTKHVESLLKAERGQVERKQGRPYLDYALRYKTGARAEPKCQEELESAHAMVQMLLNYKLDVNQKVGIHGGRTVWESYVYFMFDNSLGDEYHRKIAWLLINHGAKPTQDRIWSVDCRETSRSNHHDDVVEVGCAQSDQYSSFSVLWMLKELFGEEEAGAMHKAIMKNGWKPRMPTWLSIFSIFPWLSFQGRSPGPVKNYVWEDMSNVAEL